VRYEFSEAMDFGFECPDGSPMEAMENDHLVEAIDRRLAELRAELNVEPDADVEAEAEV
jgi:transcription initiation factor TFIIE subunit alpha